MPPLAAIVATPSLIPLHDADCADVEVTIAEGELIRTVSLAVHPLASVTITVYVPDVRFNRVSVVAPVFQR